MQTLPVKPKKNFISSTPTLSHTGGSMDGSAMPAKAAKDLAPNELLALLQVSDAMAASETLEQVLDHIVRHAAQLTGAVHAAIGLLENNTLKFIKQVGLPRVWAREVEDALHL